MSLVSTWVKAVDGKYYQNPTYRGDGLFICFDDDEPPEIVISLEKHKNPSPRAILNRIGLPYANSSVKRQYRSVRIFTGETPEGQEAISYLFNLKGRVPVPIEFDSCVESRDKIGQGCIEGEL